ncbi:hypothetical protein AB0I22_18475 [Streptomyces sp. NPDC050610]|uniref:hypothetical protein n=1 Tax=Streptomyces sp. NPDC050610 TaxID=3157097 RepID=UPI003428ACBB
MKAEGYDGRWTPRVLPLSHARRLTGTVEGRGPGLLVYDGPAGLLDFARRGHDVVTV